MTDSASRFGGSATAVGSCRGCGLAATCAASVLALLFIDLLEELADDDSHAPSGPQNSQPVPVPEPDPEGPTPGSGGEPGKWDPDKDPADPRRELVPAGA